MEEAEASEIVTFLLQCLTELNVADAEAACVDGVVSGRIVAQVLTQLLPCELDDDLYKVANLDTDADITRVEREKNWRVLTRKIMELFDSSEYDLSSPDLWMFQVDDLLNFNVDAIVHLLNIIISGAFVSETQARTKILKTFEEFPREVQDEIQNSVATFIQRVKKSKNNDGSGDTANSSLEIQQYKSRLAEVCQARDALKREKVEFLALISDLQATIDQNKKDSEELTHLRAQLEDSALKVRFFENSVESMKADILSNQRTIQELEFRASTLGRKLEEKEESLRYAQDENQNLRDECDILRQSESKLNRKVKENEGTIRLLERDVNKAKQLEKQLEISQQRVEEYVKQLAATDSMKTRMSSMQQLLENHEAQHRELNLELQTAISRANNAEAQILYLKEQIKQDNTSRAEERSEDLANSFSSNAAVSLQDELSTFSFHQQSEESAKAMRELADWKTKCESLASENVQLQSQLKNDKDLNESTHSDYAAQIERERTQAERAESMRIGLSKRVSELERSTEVLDAENISLKEENQKLKQENKRLSESVGKASDVIREYSNGQNSSAEVVKMKNELEKKEREVERLQQKIDQQRCESTQEQRLITGNWYEMASKLAHNNMHFRAANGHSMANGTGREMPQSAKTFIRSQLETAEFTASTSSTSEEPLENANPMEVPAEGDADNEIIVSHAKKVAHAVTCSLWCSVKPWMYAFFALLAALILFVGLRFDYCVRAGNGPCTLFGNLPRLQAEYVRDAGDYLNR